MMNKIAKIIILILLIFPLSLLRPAKALAAATFSLSPATKTMGVGDTFDVSIIVDTGGQNTNGGKATLSFDPVKFSVVDSNSLVSGIQVTPGTAFTTTPTTNTADNVVGKVTMDYGINANTFTGSGVFGKFTLKALATASSTPVTFINCSDGSLSCSLYVGTNNVLGTTTGGSYTITSGASSLITATPTPSVTQQEETSDLPVTGAFENTIMLLVFGFLMTFGAYYFFRKSSV